MRPTLGEGRQCMPSIFGRCIDGCRYNGLMAIGEARSRLQGGDDLWRTALVGTGAVA